MSGGQLPRRHLTKKGFTVKKTLLVVFSAALALVLLSSGLANTENKLNASSEDSEATQATNSLVVISSESGESPNSESTTLAVIDDVLVGTNPSPIVPMGAYKMDDPSSCGLEASEAANDGDIIDEIPDNLKPSPLLPMGIYEISGDDFAALWAGETPDYLFAKIDAEEFESVGHLIDLAENAAAKLNDAVPGGAGAEINDMIAGFKSEKAATDPEYLEVTAMVGQVINVARPFYNRLHEVDGVVWPDSLDFIGGNGKYPWPDLPENAGDSEKINYYAFAKKGQAKNLFAWSLKPINANEMLNGESGSGNGNSNNETRLKEKSVGYILRSSSAGFMNDGLNSYDNGLSKTVAFDNSGDDDKVKSIIAKAGVIKADTSRYENAAQTNGTETFWNFPNARPTSGIMDITLGMQYTVRHCYFLSHSPGSELAGYCLCSSSMPRKTSFDVPIEVYYYTKTHTCVNAYQGHRGDDYSYGTPERVLGLQGSAETGVLHGPGTQHVSTLCGTSFEPWVWDIKEEEQHEKTIKFGRNYQTDENPTGKRTVKVDHSSYNIDVSLEHGNFSLEIEKIGLRQTKITITPGALAGQYEGSMKITAKDDWNTYNVTYKLEHVGDSGRVSTYPLSESSGPKYRKVSLTGRPINDDKPQAEDESDFTPPETFVDALSQNLRHNVNDYIQPIPTSNDLVLAVRRNYNSEVWTMKSGLRPEEREDLPFGQCWNSNIVSYVQFERFVPLNTSKRSEPDYATVVDENGQQFRFVMVAIGNSMRFFPMPNDRSDAQAFLNTLAFDADGDLVFKKRFGTTLTYKNASLSKRIANDRIGENKSGSTDYSWYRLYEVADRFGNKIRYEYAADAKKKLVPNKIWNVLPTGVTNVALQIQQNASSGLVEKITCPMGLELNYSYDANGRMKTVRKGGVDQPNIFTYEYISRSEENVWHAIHGKAEDDYSYTHVDLKSIQDGVGNEYVFDYKGLTPYYYYAGRNISGGGVYSRRGTTLYVPSGKAGRITDVTIKQNGEAISHATFEDNSTVILNSGTLSSDGGYVDASDEVGEGETPVTADRTMVVTDGLGNKVKYTWALPKSASGDDDLKNSAVAYELDSFRDIYGLGPSDPFNNPSVVYYKCMAIEYLDAADTSLGKEKVTFDINAGMAISSHTDMYGNTTTFSYDDLITRADSEKGLYYASKYSDPTSQTDALGNVTEFTYDANTRIMTSVKKKSAGATGYERQTIWTVDDLGRRIKEQIYGADGNIEKETENKFEDSRFLNFMNVSSVKDGAGSGRNIEEAYLRSNFGNIASKIRNSGTTRYEYNNAGRKTVESQPVSNTTRFAYDSLQRLASITNSDNTTKTFTYDAIGRKLTETNENGNTTSYEYNALHKVTKVTQPLDVITQTEYNAVGMPVKVTDPNGNATVFEYDALHRLVKKTQYSGETAMGVTAYEYGANSGSNLFSTDGFKPVKVTNTRGYVSEFTYDALYRLTKSDEEYAKTDDDTATYIGDGVKTTSFTYDIFGNKTSETDDNGYTTTFEYNALDKLLKTTFADNSSKTATYSPSGLLLMEKDETGATTKYEYDLSGRLIKKTYPVAYDYDTQSDASPSEGFAYDAADNLIAHTDPRGNVTNYTYNTRNRLIREEKPSVRMGDTETFARPRISITYDGVGNKISITEPNGQQTSMYDPGYKTLFEYDALNRLVKTTFPAVDVAQYTGNKVTGIASQVLFETLEYDANGNITKKTDTAGNETVTTYNYLNKPLTVTNPPLGYYTPNTTDTFTYDTEGNLVSITDMDGIKTTYEYDGLNRRTKALYYATASSENQRTKNYVYDGLNLRIDNTVYKSYDSRNRVSKTGPSESYANISYTYDKASRITAVIGSGSNIARADYEYNANGVILKERSGDNSAWNIYKYDLSGNRRFADYMTYGYSTSDDMHEETIYDSNNRVTEIKDKHNRVTQYYYDLNGNVTKKIYPNGDTISRSYDALNRLTHISTENNGVETISCVYTYDAAGNLASFTQECDGRTQSLSMKYDPLNRLTNEYGKFAQYEEGQYQNSYTYGSYKLISQWTYRNGSNGINYNYKPGTMMLDEIFPQSGSGSVAKFTYDSMGNISKIVKGGKTNEFVYNNYGWLVGSHEYGSPLAYSHTGYTYDYRGRRTIKIVAETGETVNYWYSGGVCVVESSNKTGRKLFYRGPDMGGGVGGINYSCKSDGSDLNYKHYNLRGDVIVTTDSAGNVLSQSQYEAYGDHTDFGEMPTDKHRANTKVEDTETNLLLEGHRYRHLEYKTFMSPDPLEYVDGLNFYAYCGYNPWGRWDPLGLNRKNAGDHFVNHVDRIAWAMGQVDPKEGKRVSQQFYNARTKELPEAVKQGLAAGVETGLAFTVAGNANKLTGPIQKTAGGMLEEGKASFKILSKMVNETFEAGVNNFSKLSLPEKIAVASGATGTVTALTGIDNGDASNAIQNVSFGPADLVIVPYSNANSFVNGLPQINDAITETLDSMKNMLLDKNTIETNQENKPKETQNRNGKEEKE